MLKNFLISAGILFLLEFYVFEAVKTLTSNSWWRAGYWVVTAAVYIIFIVGILTLRRSNPQALRLQILVSLFLIFILPKILISIFLLTDDLFRLGQYAFQNGGEQHTNYPGRRKFLSIAGVGLATLFSVAVLDGIIFGKYRHYVRRVRLKLSGLPAAFSGYRIVQISDVHSGSFLHSEKLQHAIDLIKKQKPDLVLFTGDMVNNYAHEFKPFVKMFAEVQPPDGKFSVLGNHDYGGYVRWNSEAEKLENLQELLRLQREAGFDMLLDEHRIIEKNGQKLYILGVQNWGEKPFPQLGDLDKAAAGVPPEAAKILMSHDPTHFDVIVKKHPANVQLTLSGHTHGMQFGLDLKNVRWSPVQYRYPKWADLYESAGKYLYVNRGFGVIGYPGRVGIDPEITLFELQ